MPCDVQEVFQDSKLSQDPARTNLFMYVLDHRGQVVHSFHGLPGGGRAGFNGRSDYTAEITKALNAPMT
jgi:hypothetical protein